MDVSVFVSILLCSTCKFPNVHSATFPLIKCKPIKCSEKNRLRIKGLCIILYKVCLKYLSLQIFTELCWTDVKSYIRVFYQNSVVFFLLYKSALLVSKYS
jgi:hypothetical protein